MFDELVRRLLTDGRVVLREPPLPAPGARERAIPHLARAHEAVVLDTAGPPLAFVPEVALAAAELVLATGWALLHPGDAAALARVTLDATPRTADQHLSADVALRLLATLHKRAQAYDEPLAARLDEVLARFPLSGALARVAVPPRSFDLGGHPGLELIFAERLARDVRPAWVPPPGRLRDRLEYALHERGEALVTREEAA